MKAWPRGEKSCSNTQIDADSLPTKWTGFFFGGFGSTLKAIFHEGSSMSVRIILCLLLSLSLSLTCSLAAADVYKTVDKNGKVVYTDKPDGKQPAELVKLPPVNTLPSEPTNTYVPTIAPNADVASYQVSIVSPRNNATITAEQRDLGIAITLDRPLDSSHWLLYFMNGELLEETQASNIFIQEITRGTHTLEVEVVAKDGTSLGKSAQVVVNVMRPIVKPVKPQPKK
jgi:hypothetical protein